MPTTTATVLTRPEPTRDRHNNPVTDWSTAQRTAYPAYLRLVSTQETVQASDQVTEVWDCYVPPGAAVTVYDRVEVDGTVYDVDGAPRRPKGYGPLAVLDHTVVTLKRVSG